MHQGHWLVTPETGNSEQPHSTDGPNFLPNHPQASSHLPSGREGIDERLNYNQVVAKVLILLVLKP